MHRLCGHPGNRALVQALAARGADGITLAIAEKLQCLECQESQLAQAGPRVSLEKETVLWRTLQMDGFEYRHGSQVLHFLLMLDEASGFSVVQLMFQHGLEESENMTSDLVLSVLLRAWIQYFGTPHRIRCDPEGAFRGTLLSDYCKSRDIDLQLVPAEHHESTGDVERAIGELKRKMTRCLREATGVSPWMAA